MASVQAVRGLACAAFAAALVTAGCSAAPASLPVASSMPAPSVAPSAAPSSIAVATPSVSPPPSPTPLVVPVPGPNERYRLGPDVTSGERALVQEWVAYSVALQERLFGRRFTPFTVIAAHDPRWVARQDCKVRPPGMPDCLAQQTEIYRDALMGGCFPAPSSVKCFVIGSLDVRGAAGPAYGFKVMAHEVHHVLQGELMPEAWRATMVGSERVWSTGPVWLLEGAAEWVGWRLAFDRGLASRERERAEWEEWSRRTEASLSQLETRGAIDRTVNSYLVSTLAVDELLTLAPEGPRALVAYYRAVARGVGWKTAFAKAFGLTPAAFYTHFEGVRAGIAGG